MIILHDRIGILFCDRTGSLGQGEHRSSLTRITLPLQDRASNHLSASPAAGVRCKACRNRLLCAGLQATKIVSTTRAHSHPCASWISLFSSSKSSNVKSFLIFHSTRSTLEVVGAFQSSWSTALQVADQFLPLGARFGRFPLISIKQ